MCGVDGGISDGGISDGGISDGGISDGGISDGGNRQDQESRPRTAWNHQGVHHLRGG
ncbi:hypothetical protein CA13_71440 [Planctomycetes bacterium CA13]|uniref:Uncharacterized protein n=1 Tax=Novipirellula herctigrandis TaxID=2527986 RepID=A0A5C5YP74_9BACT|nr:hypothetical protein CA13_71440 [Planctomycetes bacterium CA13]